MQRLKGALAHAGFSGTLQRCVLNYHSGMGLSGELTRTLKDRLKHRHPSLKGVLPITLHISEKKASCEGLCQACFLHVQLSLLVRFY